MGLDKEKALEIALRHLNVPGMLKDIIDEVLEPALQELVQDSSNPYDDMVKAALYPVLEEKLKEKIDELWADLAA